MTDDKIISFTDFAPYKDISSNIEADERLDPYILEAQVHDLRPILGDSLYFALVSSLSDSPLAQRFDRLINGHDYVPTGKRYTVRFYGIKPMLVYFTYSRLLDNQNFFMTRSGLKVKKYEQSEQVDREERAALSSTAKGKAASYIDSLNCFLANFSDDYPEAECASKSIVAPIKIFAVRKR